MDMGVERVGQCQPQLVQDAKIAFHADDHRVDQDGLTGLRIT
jgi:hypothetical protein